MLRNLLSHNMIIQSKSENCYTARCFSSGITNSHNDGTKEARLNSRNLAGFFHFALRSNAIEQSTISSLSDGE